MKFVYLSAFIVFIVTLQSLHVMGRSPPNDPMADLPKGEDPTKIPYDSPMPVNVFFPGMESGKEEMSGSGDGGPFTGGKDSGCTEEYKKLISKWRESYYEYQHAFYLWKTGQPYSPKDPDYYGSGGEGSGYSYGGKPTHGGYP